MPESRPDKLLLVWTSADRDVALRMVLMYAGNAQRRQWWGQVTLLIWGPSQPLVLTDAEVREEVTRMHADGVRVIACKACADSYGIASQLTDLGIEVFGTGPTLTDWLKSDCRVVTF